jgi:hypothetical protein
MSSFIKNIKNSIFGCDYVRDFGNKTFWRGTGHIAILLAIELLVFVLLLLPLISSINDFLKSGQIENYFAEHFSEDSTIIFEEDGMRLEGESPLIFPAVFPEDFDASDLTEADAQDLYFENFVVFDPSVEVNPLNAKEEYKTMILVTDDKILFPDEEGIQVIGIKDFEGTFTLNLIAFWTPIVNWGAYVLLIFIWIFGTFMSVGIYWMLAVIVAIIFQLIAREKKVNMNYGKAYVITLYTFSLSILIDLITDFFGYDLNALIIIAISTVLILINLRGTKTTV